MFHVTNVGIMLFRIKLNLQPPERGNPRQITASIQYEDADFLKSHLGTFMYYHFLRDFFEDLSRFQREGEISFCKPGIGDLCITWNVSIDESAIEIRKKIRDGLEYASITSKSRYWEKYSMETSVGFFEEEGRTTKDTIEILVKADFRTQQRKASSSDLLSAQA